MAGSITGQVLNQRDGQPIAGASLTLSGDGSASGSSGNDGKFAFDNLGAGSYELLVQKDGFEDGNYGPLVVIDDVATNLPLALQPKNI